MRQRKWKASVTEKYDETSPSLGIQSLPNRVERCSHYRTVVDQPTWGIKQLSSLHKLGAQLVNLTKKPRGPYLQEKDMPVTCHVALTAISLSSKVENEGSFSYLTAAVTRQKR